MNMTRGRPEKLSRIDEVNMLNLGLRETKQETTAPQIISFHRTPQCEKGKHRTPKGLRSPQHRKLRFYSPHHRSEKTQHHNTANPLVPLSVAWYKIIMQRSFLVHREIQHYAIADDILFPLYLSSAKTLVN